MPTSYINATETLVYLIPQAGWFHLGMDPKMLAYTYIIVYQQNTGNI